MVKIRKACPEDMEDVLRLIRQLAEYEKEPEAVEIDAKELINDGFGENPLFFCYVAEEESQIVGMALFYFRYSTWKGKTVHLEDLVVDQTERRKGIGKALLRKVIEFADKEKVRRIEWVVLDWNQPAINLYQKMGAEMLHDWDIVQMSRKSYRNLIHNRNII